MNQAGALRINLLQSVLEPCAKGIFVHVTDLRCLVNGVANMRLDQARVWTTFSPTGNFSRFCHV